MHFPLNELNSLRDWVRWGASRFNAADLSFGQGTDNALDEALALVLHALHLDHSLPETYLDCRVSAEEARQILSLLLRREQERLPAAYLIGRTGFAGLEFEVSPQVLIPRSPLAELIEQGLAPWLEPEAIERGLDLCTGSGCIALALAHYLPQARIDAVELSAEALAVAERNRQRLGLEDQVQFYQGDLFQPLPEDARYQVILSNPPYVHPREYAALPEEYRHEPRLGLEAADEGLAIVISILRNAGKFLTPDGILVVEVGSSAETLQQRYPEAPFLWLEFERGGDGVFLLSAEQLQQQQF
ncbi:50S ribosomal protein L3 N(5)-glutamine methyltransferase [Magnetovirga frankeli]|uniref:50S ribosomal protein L3 N(5)-glutamine methyltransferase n=1 Tax=Magnetovirga frankeli TaxID=947516 RepID=UPI0012933A52|nr:50S ribosomal protein L3 N(5)-glutamine methyltransferase [gamma proteobacterium SS-5]